ncbi:MAG: carbon starvation protein A [Planctomycetes bacterium]|nr:carbon starvation protein A [Planctomycetota bacterium]
MNALPIMLATLLILAIGYRYYSAFLAARICALDDARVTPAHRLNDGQNYHPTHKWVLFGHHFAAISGAGPLIGPVLAIQFGFLPGLLWLLVGVVMAGAVQDMLVLAASVRHEGRSLAEIARMSIGPMAGRAASIAILFIVIVALAGLGVVVVKALGGEETKLAAETALQLPPNERVQSSVHGKKTHLRFPAGTTIKYRAGTSVKRTVDFVIAIPTPPATDVTATAAMANLLQAETVVLPTGTVELVAGSSWGTFTIACTIPIALFVGLYMYKIRPGRVVEASIVGAIGVLAATVAGNWIPGSSWEPYFSLSREATIWAICIYGFVASVLPVWMLLCPRDYLSSFLKIGTVMLLVVGVIVANPVLHAPKINHLFAGGGGPYFSGAIFPFVFICIMCGAISGFHALVSSGTTPKMISKESHVRTIGYGAMLIEGLVGIVALIAAASLPQADYWAINIDLSKVEQYAEKLKMNETPDNLATLERQVGGESLRGRTGGAVTLAVGMSKILTDAFRIVFGDRLNIDSMIKYWYHFAIMFEALFILTTIDTGTRIARFLLHESLGKIYKPLDRVDWLPGAILCTGLVTAGWGGLIWTGSIETIWPMFGIANQLLAAIALCVVTSVMVSSGKARYTPVTLVPLAFVTTTTVTAAVQMIGGRFGDDLTAGIRLGLWPKIIQGGLNIGVTVLLLGCFILIFADAATRWYRAFASPSRA